MASILGLDDLRYITIPTAIAVTTMQGTMTPIIQNFCSDFSVESGFCVTVEDGVMEVWLFVNGSEVAVIVDFATLVVVVEECVVSSEPVVTVGECVLVKELVVIKSAEGVAFVVV